MAIFRALSRTASSSCWARDTAVAAAAAAPLGPPSSWLAARSETPAGPKGVSWPQKEEDSSDLVADDAVAWKRKFIKSIFFLVGAQRVRALMEDSVGAAAAVAAAAVVGNIISAVSLPPPRPPFPSPLLPPPPPEWCHRRRPSLPPPF